MYVYIYVEASTLHAIEISAYKNIIINAILILLIFFIHLWQHNTILSFYMATLETHSILSSLTF